MSDMNWRIPPAMTEEQRELAWRIFEREQRIRARRMTGEQDDDGPDGEDAWD